MKLVPRDSRADMVAGCVHTAAVSNHIRAGVVVLLQPAFSLILSK